MDSSSLGKLGAFAVVLVLTAATCRARGVWLAGLVAGFLVPWIGLGADWRLPIYLFAFPAVSWPIAAGIALGVLIGIEIDRRTARRAGSSA